MTPDGDSERINILFLTWDGPQTTYLEGLFLPIFERLRHHGLCFHVVQFTWGGKRVIEHRRQACEAAGLPYRVVRVWRRPNVSIGSFLTALRGVFDLGRAIREWQIAVVMPRSVLPALTTLLALKGRTLPLVFDADGLPLDERVDFAGQSPASLVYRILRDVEAQAVRRSSIVLTRTPRASGILLARAGAGTDPAKFHVVGNGRDPERFAPGEPPQRQAVRARLGIGEDVPLLVYAGSLGPQYDLAGMLRLFKLIRARRGDAHLLMLTASTDLLKEALSAQPQLATSVTALTLPAEEVPGHLACADLGLALRVTSFSMQAVAPIKIGEYLLCGLPVVASAGAGDLDDSLNSEVAFLLDDQIAESSLSAAADWFIERVLPNPVAFRKRCRAFGLSRFSLDETTETYKAALRFVMGA